MKNKDELYIGRQTRPKTCPVCMRTRENAIAEQLQAGKPCGHENCRFKLEIDLITTILGAPDLEQSWPITSENIEIKKKIFDLLVSLRESVRGLKDSLRTETQMDNSPIGDPDNLSGSEATHKLDVSNEQLQAITDRIDHASRTLSRLIEKTYHQPSSDSLLRTPDDSRNKQTSADINESEEKRNRINRERNEYLKYRKDYNRRLDEAFVKASEALRGMREAVQEMKEEISQEETSQSELNPIWGLADKIARLLHLKK